MGAIKKELKRGGLLVVKGKEMRGECAYVLQGEGKNAWLVS
jgi:hypothetical protein